MEAKIEETHPGPGPAFQRRLKAIAALKGVSMRGYCLGCHWSGVGAGRGQRPVFFRAERLTLRHKVIFDGKPLSGDSADLIREAREDERC